MQTISVEEVKKRLDSGESLHLLDVREPHEHADFNICGTLLSLGRIQQMDTDEIEGWKDDEVIVYCRSGNRSGIAGMVLDQLGFTNTKNLIGGMLGWQQKFGR